jgi:type I restriction enzyme, S subunit
MELRAGYKQTEVGVIPEDWNISDLQGVCAETITYGIVQCGPHVQNGVPYIRVSDMNNEQLDVAGMLRTAPAIAAQFSRSRVSEGDIVYALRGKIGEVRRISSDVAGANLTQGTARLSPSSRLDSTYLLWSLRSQRALRQGDLAAKGSTFREITLKALRQIQLPVPPIAEQRAIATTLSDVDALLAMIDRLLAKKRDLKQAAMQQLLTGKTRLPGFSGNWEVKRLGDLAHIKTGAKNNDDKVEDGEYPLFVRSQTVERINSYSYDCEAILVPGEGGIGSIFHYINGKFDCHQRVYKISAFNADTCGKFVFFCMKHFFHIQASRNSVKATVDSLRLPTFVEFEFLAPGFDEQQAIVEVLDDIDAELTALEARRNKTSALKQGMMQALLTGRIRLLGAN